MDDKITVWLGKLAEGDELAAQRIWEHYCGELVKRARRKLGDAPRRAADEDDVAQSAFRSFCEGVEAGRFPQLNDRYDLHKLLMTITARKAMAYARHERRKKRGGGAVRGESALIPRGSDEPWVGIEQALGREPSPDFALLHAEQCERMLQRLEDPALRKVALLKLAGHTVQEIARETDCAYRTVKRRLAQIRQAWQSEIEG
jgi:RNA polymerase sigma factor (sigma-70 family)